MNVDIYDAHSIKIGTITLPDKKVSTKFLRDNWPAIISGPLLKLLLGFRGCGGLYEDRGTRVSEQEFTFWLQNPENWKRKCKERLTGTEEDEVGADYWGMTYPLKDCIHRMFMTDEFEDGMDLNFFSSPKDASLLSIHLHSD